MFYTWKGDGAEEFLPSNCYQNQTFVVRLATDDNTASEIKILVPYYHKTAHKQLFEKYSDGLKRHFPFYYDLTNKQLHYYDDMRLQFFYVTKSYESTDEETKEYETAMINANLMVSVHKEIIHKNVSVTSTNDIIALTFNNLDKVQFKVEGSEHIYYRNNLHDIVNELKENESFAMIDNKLCGVEEIQNYFKTHLRNDEEYSEIDVNADTAIKFINYIIRENPYISHYTDNCFILRKVNVSN